MPRYIPYDMLQDLQLGITTHCLLIRFIPAQPGYAEYGMALHDQPIKYDDGDGLLDYSPVVAMQPSTMLASADLSVDGGEGAGLVPEFDTPISEDDVVAGGYDFCRFRAYLVDYRKLSPGRHVLLQEGTTGQMRLTDVGMAFTQELRGKAQALRQSITEKWSLSCRAIFGSQSTGDYFQKIDVENADFTASASGWSLTEPDPDYEATVAWSSTGGKTTPGCVKVTARDALMSIYTGKGLVTSGIYPAVSGNTISASASARAVPRPVFGARGRSSVRLVWVDGVGNPVSTPSEGAETDHTGNDGWAVSRVRAVVPSGASGFRIAVYVYVGPGEGTAEMYIDDVRCSYSDPSISPPENVQLNRFPCLFDAESLWEPGEVATVGLESSITFTTSGLAPTYGGNPGKVRWLTGRNAGREYETDTFEDNSGDQTVGLTFPTMFPIEVGDTFEFRDDCPKTKAACKARGNWSNFRGEPNIPVGDAGQASVPGASAGIGTGGRLQIGNSEEQ